MRELQVAATSQTIYLFIQNSTSTTGGGLTGLAYNTSGLTAYYVINGAASAAITLATLAAASSAWSSGGFKEVDSTNCPGLYRLDLPNAAIASGVSTVVYLQGAANMVPIAEEIMLTAYNPQDAVHLGLSAIPNAAAAATGGLPTVGTGSGQINPDGLGNVSLGAILGSSITGTAANIAAAFKLFFNVGSPVLTTASVNQTGDSYARLGTPAGASVSADIAAIKALLPPGTLVTRQGTAQAGGASTITLDSGASATNSIFNAQEVFVYGGTGAGQCRVITGYVGSTKVATVDRAWQTNPDNTSTFMVLAGDNAQITAAINAGSDLQTILGTASAGQAGSVSPDWGQVKNPTTALDLTQTTIKNLDGNTIQTADVGVKVPTALTYDTNNIPKVALTDIINTALSESVAGYLAAGFKKFLNVATPVFTAASVNQTADVGVQVPTALQYDVNGWPKVDVADWLGSVALALPTNFNLLSINGSGFTTFANTTIGTITGNVNGSVGSVAGNVGGNVVGSVGSISGVTFPGNFSVLSIDASGNVQLIPSESPLLRTGTAQAGAAGSITLDSGASATNGAYVGCKVRVRSGTGALLGQRIIIAYVGSTKVATVDWNFTTTPDNTSVFDVWYDDSPALNSSLAIIGAIVSGSVNVGQWNGTNVAAPNVAGVPLVDTGYFKGTPSAGAAGFVGPDWSALTGQGSAQNLSSTRIQSQNSGVIVTTNNDKTGYALTSAEHTLISGTDVPAGLTQQGYTSALATLLSTFQFVGNNVKAIIEAVGDPADIAAAVLNATNSSYNVSGSIGANILLASSGGNPSTFAAAVWNALVASYQLTGSFGAAIALISGGANPWDLTTSGHDTVGTFGYVVQNLPTTVSGAVLAALAGRSITVTGYVGPNGTFTVQQGKAYTLAFGNAFSFKFAGVEDLTGLTVEMIYSNGGALVGNLTPVTTGPGITQVFALELTDSQSAALANIPPAENFTEPINYSLVVTILGQTYALGNSSFTLTPPF